MSVRGKIKREGISLRMTFIVMLIAAVFVTSVLMVATYRTYTAFNELSEITDKYIELQAAASELMSGSDYLTEEVQCYTVLGERVHMENYLREALETRSREKALQKVRDTIPDSPALEKLEKAMSSSMGLMEREYYAILLVLYAQGDHDIPEALKQYSLSDADRTLTATQAMEKARKMAHDEIYYSQKDEIRNNLANCINELKSQTRTKQSDMEKQVSNRILGMGILIFVQTLGFVLMLVLTTKLGINPLLQAVEHIKKDQSLPIMGANEFRYLAATYNKMYIAYKKSISNLSFKASHDELTKVYNRAGYDLIGKSIDPKSTAYLLIDVDKFKNVNDRYGHETGDKVLCRLAEVLRQSFRSDDYIFRIGGDEFVVMMVHVTPELKELIQNKIENINRGLKEEKNDIPGITVSVGVALCQDAPDYQELYRRADVALYRVKENGRNGCCFC